MLKLLYQSLRALESKSFNNELVRVIFELKAMAVNGEGPSVFSCMHCHSKDDLHKFSVQRGGIFCDECGRQIPGMYILDDTRYTLQYIIATDIKKLFSFTVSEEVLAELKRIMKEYLQVYVHHTFNSASFI